MKAPVLKIDAQDFYELAQLSLSNGCMVRFRARGKSMLPHISDGDIISVAPVNKKKLKRGNIVMHRLPHSSGIVVHRIIKTKRHKAQTIVYTRGDAADGIPDKISPDDILGVAVTVEHSGSIIYLTTLSKRLSGIRWIYRQKLRHFIRRYQTQS